MLAADLDLEADLGIDTVKQAELFATIRERIRHRTRRQPQAPRLPDPQPRPRLRPATAPHNQSPPIRPPPTTVDRPHPPRKPAWRPALRSTPSRVASPSSCCVLRSSTACPTGVVLGAGSRVVVLADAGGVARPRRRPAPARRRDVRRRRRSRRRDARRVGSPPGRRPARSQACTGYRRSTTRVPTPRSTATTWREGLRVRVKLLAATMRELYSDVAPPGTFLVSATRLGGHHGYGPAGASAPMGGAVTGFTKAYARERADALVKAVDFGPDDDARAIAERLIAETLLDPGAVEVGRCRRAALERRPRRRAGRRRRPGTVAYARERVRDHRCGRQHRLGHHHRPRRLRRYVPPARPRGRA